MQDIYFAMPGWLSAAGVMLLAVAICVGGHRLAHRLFPKPAPEEGTELAVALMGVVSAFIGIMLAFAAVQVWQDYADADKAVALEAASLSELYRDMSVYGDQTLPARRAVEVYVHAVVEDEWPRLAHGEPSPKAVGGLIQMFREVGKIEPVSNRDTAMYGEIFSKLNQVVEYRRARMISSRAALPELFWIVALAGSAVIVSYTFVFPPTPLNGVIIGGLGVSLSLIFVFILAVNHPFAGAYSVDHKELSDLIPLFEVITAADPTAAAAKR
jgi:lipid-A-disaccharide synthase-like uncharacterized protein